MLTASVVGAAPFDPDEADPTTWRRLEYVNFWAQGFTAGAQFNY